MFTVPAAAMIWLKLALVTKLLLISHADRLRQTLKHARLTGGATVSTSDVTVSQMRASAYTEMLFFLGNRSLKIAKTKHLINYS